MDDVDDDGDLDAFVTNANNQANKVWFNERTDVGDITSDQAGIWCLHLNLPMHPHSRSLVMAVLLSTMF